MRLRMPPDLKSDPVDEWRRHWFGLRARARPMIKIGPLSVGPSWPRARPRFRLIPVTLRTIIET